MNKFIKKKTTNRNNECVARRVALSKGVNISIKFHWLLLSEEIHLQGKKNKQKSHLIN